MRILFITANRLGDAVLSTGLLNWLTEQHPDARIWVACGPVAAPLFRGLRNCERVIPLHKRRFGGHWLRLWRETVTRRWDLVVDLRASAIAYLLPTRGRRIAGRAAADLHRVENLGRLFDLDPPPSPRLWETEADRTLARERIPDGRTVLALGPAANWRGKQWRAERFAALADRLTGPDGLLPGAPVAVFAAPGERDQVAAVLDAIPADRRIDLVGALDPLQAYSCLRRCALYIGNDSGLMHLAAAAGIPTLGLFGPSREQHYRPWGANADLVRTTQPYEALVGGPGYDHRTTDTLMDSLDVDAVQAAAGALWQKTRSAA